MKAAVPTRYGPPDVVRVVDVPMPTPTDNEVLVKVHATTVNRTDCGFRGAKPFFVRVLTGLVRPRVKILGNEFAGQVEALGPGATSFAVGDRVFGYDDSVCGAHAQYLTIREAAQNPFLALITPALPGKSVLFGFPRHDQAMMNYFKDLMDSGLFRPVIDRSYPLKEIVDAYRYVETGQKIGNVVIIVEHGD